MDHIACDASVFWWGFTWTCTWNLFDTRYAIRIRIFIPIPPLPDSVFDILVRSPAFPRSWGKSELYIMLTCHAMTITYHKSHIHFVLPSYSRLKLQREKSFLYHLSKPSKLNKQTIINRSMQSSQTHLFCFQWFLDCTKIINSVFAEKCIIPSE